MKKLLVTTAALLAILNTPLAGANDAHHPSTAMTGGEVRKVDKGAQKITLKHEEIKNLDMPPMTMVFRVKDPAMLDKLKAGDKVKFAAEEKGGTFTITSMEVAK